MPRFRLIAIMTCALSVAVPPRAGELAHGLTGGVTAYTTVAGDTLQGIGARFGIDVATLAGDNQLDLRAALPVGVTLRADNRHLVPAAAVPGTITINLPQRMLFYEAEGVARGLPVAVGRPDWKTPARPFVVLTKEANPAWDVPASIREEARRAGRHLPAVVPPGPNNPLGAFWIGLSLPSVGIHGTNAPASIYRAATHGCIRVGPDDIAWLFPRVAVGTPGQVIYEPILLAVVDGEILLEVHGDVYRRLRGDPDDLVEALAEAAGLAPDIDWDRVAVVIEARRGVATRVGTRSTSVVDRMFSR